MALVNNNDNSTERVINDVWDDDNNLLKTGITDGTNSVEVDDDGNLKVVVAPSEAEGGQDEIRTSDDNTQELLGEVLKQLKIMNLHLALMTDTQIRKQEIM